MMRTRCMRSVVGLVAVLVLATSAAQAGPWMPPTATDYWETVWGYLSDFPTIQAGDGVAAFRVDDDQIGGLTTLSWDGTSFGYNMIVFAPDAIPFDVYFKVWDGTSELGAIPNFTSHPDKFGAGPTQHDLSQSPAVPEPATLSLLALGGLGVRIRRKRN